MCFALPAQCAWQHSLLCVGERRGRGCVSQWSCVLLCINYVLSVARAEWCVGHSQQQCNPGSDRTGDVRHGLGAILFTARRLVLQPEHRLGVFVFM